MATNTAAAAPIVGNRWSAQETAGIAEMRNRLRSELAATGQFPEVIGDRALVKFLRGHGHNVDKATSMYGAYLKWRKDHGVDAIREAIVRGGLNHPDLFPLADKWIAPTPQIIISAEAKDVCGNPIAVETYNYSPKACMQDLTVEQYSRFMMHTMEYKTLILEQLSEEKERKYLEQCNYNPPRTQNGYGVILQCTIIRDLSGLSREFMSAEAKTVLTAALAIAQNNYPEMLFKSHIVNSPWIFSTIWYFVKGLIDPKTAAKVTFNGSDFIQALANEVTADNIPTFLGGKYPYRDRPFLFDTSEFGLMHLFGYASPHASYLDYMRGLHHTEPLRPPSPPHPVALPRTSITSTSTSTSADTAAAAVPTDGTPATGSSGDTSVPSEVVATAVAPEPEAATTAATTSAEGVTAGEVVLSGILYSTSQHGFEHAKGHHTSGSISNASSQDDGAYHPPSVEDLHLDNHHHASHADKAHSHGHSEATKKLIHAVIFDLDGTLLDTETISAQAIQEIVSPLLVNGAPPVVTEELKSKTLGLTDKDWSELVVKELGLEGQMEAAELVVEYHKRMAQLMPSVQPCLGAYDIVNRVSALPGIVVGLATSSSSDMVALKRAAHPELFNKFKAIVCGDDVEVTAGKPSPQIFQVACRRLGAAHDQCLVFEDSLAGVQASRAAGMSVCAVIPTSATDKLRRCVSEVAVREHDAVVASLVEVDLARWGHKEVLLLS